MTDEKKTWIERHQDGRRQVEDGASDLRKMQRLFEKIGFDHLAEELDGILFDLFEGRKKMVSAVSDFLGDSVAKQNEQFAETMRATLDAANKKS